MTTVTALLNVARGELGYIEGRNNASKYGKAYGLDNAPWCAMFLWWCGRRASGGDTLVPQIAYTPAMARHYMAQGTARWGTTPRRGAIAFFDFPDTVHRIQHVGLVEKVHANGTITTIEGNTSSGVRGSQADGGGVYRRVRPVSLVVVYAYPAYTRESVVRPAPRPVSRSTRPRRPLAVDGIWGKATTSGLQVVLRDNPVDGVIDRDFRRDVERWLSRPQNGVWDVSDRKALQRRVGAKDDGAIGPLTVRALQRYINRHL